MGTALASHARESTALALLRALKWAVAIVNDHRVNTLPQIVIMAIMV
jgi:hypothetical protein